MHIFPQRDEANRLQSHHPPKVFRGVALVLVAVALLAASISVFASRVVNNAHAAGTWTPIWSDNFDGAAGSGLNTANWRYDTGTGWGTGEIENMTSSTANVKLDGNSHLQITALRDGNGNWTSGRIESQRSDFAAPAGGMLQVSASVQQPNVSGAAAAGYWPAFWMLGAQYRVDGNWPHDGEIDIMEDINGLSSVFGTLHCGVDPGGPCNETTGIGSGQHACPGCQTSFHTYSMIVDRSVSPEQIRWYLDGNNYFTINANQVDSNTWTSAVDHGFYIIFDLAMGGGFPNAFGGGPTGATQSGASMLVDNVQVSTMGGSTTSPTPTPQPPTPTPTQPGTGSGFTQSTTSVGASQAQFSFHPNGWSAGYVIAHYTVNGGSNQQNVNMAYNSSTSSWTYTIGGLNPNDVINYSFTYQQNGLQYNSGSYSYTFGAPTPTPVPNGSFSQSVSSVGSNQALFAFQPSGWTAGYVILHYTVAGSNAGQQNLNMNYNSGTSRWEYTAGGINSGNAVTYFFTYQKGGLQYDSGSYSWTHP